MYLGASPGDEPGRKVPLCTFLVRSIMCAYAGTYVCATVCTSPRNVSRQVIPNRQASPLASRNVPVCRHFGIQRNMGSGSLLSPTEKRALDPLQRKGRMGSGSLPVPTEKGGVFSRERAPLGVRGCNLATTKRDRDHRRACRALVLLTILGASLRERRTCRGRWRPSWNLTTSPSSTANNRRPGTCWTGL